VFGVGAYFSPAAIIVLTASIAAGVAVANIADRLTAGSVTDFIDIGRWPVFNLADMFLIVGGVLLVLDDTPKKSDTQVVCN